MKTLKFTFVFVFFSSLSFANVLTVDNRSGSSSQYASINSAIGAASIGDTLLIHPSNTSYGNFSLVKSLVFVGPGHHPEYTGGTGASIGTITLHPGSSGSKFMGLTLNMIQCVLNGTSHNIEIINNYFYSITAIRGRGLSTNNWIIKGNVIVEDPGCGGCAIITVANNSNWVISNNFIQTKSIGNNTYLFSGLNSTTFIENNIIVHLNDGALFYTDVDGGEFRNNIFWVSNANFTDITFNSTNLVFKNNLSYHVNGTLLLLTGDNNIDNSDPDFTSLDSDVPNWNYLNDYGLNTSSPGINAGIDTTDVGIHGAGFIFRMEGYPQDFPRFIDFDVLSNTIVPQGGTIGVNFNAIRAGM